MHECNHYYQGEYIFFVCPICGYKVKYNQVSRKRTKISDGDGSPHHGSSMPGFGITDVRVENPSLADILFRNINREKG